MTNFAPMGRKSFKPHRVESVPIVDTATDGKGIGKKDGIVYFVEKAVPGDVAHIWVRQLQKKQLIAVVDALETPSPDRIAARCKHFGDCGGCKWQNLSYAGQLQFKEKFVRDSIERIGKLAYGEFRPILGCLDDFNYRNKVEFSFADKQWLPMSAIEAGVEKKERGALGFHIPRVFDKIIEIEECFLPRDIINDIRNALREYAEENDLSYYNIKEHVGFLRNVVFRTSEGTGELLMNLIVAEDKPEVVEGIFKFLEAKFPQITSFIWMLNQKMNDSYSDLDYRVWKGPAYLTEHLGPWKYHISPTSFFQTNSVQAKRLYDVVRDFVGEKHGIVYDLYCGAGSIGIYVSDLAEKVVGVEYVEDAIRDAKENIQLNGLSHFSFHAGDMRKILTDELVFAEGKPDLIITDPPRAGMDEAVTRQILSLEAPRIIYVSCNPATQARDLAILAERYDILTIQPVDMFPQTAHVENVVLLALRPAEA